MKTKIFFKEELIILFVLLFFANCTNESKLKITKCNNLLKDSIILFNKKISNRSWLKSNGDDFQLLIGYSVYKFSGSICKLFIEKNLFGANADDVFEIGNFYYYDRRNHSKNLLYLKTDSIYSYPLFNSNYQFEGVHYVLQLHDYKTFVKLPDNYFLGHLLYNDTNKVTNVAKYLSNLNKNRLGLFKIENNTFVLKKVINFYPREDFLINDKRCLDISISICQDKNSFYLAPNFIDTIFHYNFKGDLLESVQIPNEMNFKYFDNSSINELINQNNSISSITGSKNMRLFYNKESNNLVLVTLIGLNQEIEYEVFPSINELEWLVSIYDIKNKKWTNIILFDKNHDYRNVFFYKNSLFVKRNNSSSFILDKYVF